MVYNNTEFSSVSIWKHWLSDNLVYTAGSCKILSADGLSYGETYNKARM